MNEEHKKNLDAVNNQIKVMMDALIELTSKSTEVSCETTVMHNLFTRIEEETQINVTFTDT